MFPFIMIIEGVDAIPFARGWTQHILKTICLAELMKYIAADSGISKLNS